MIFSSAVFLFAFLPITLLLYFLARGRAKNTVLLAASLVFYFCTDAKYTPLLIASAFFNFLFGILIYKSQSKRRKKLFLMISVLSNLLFLGYFKYSGFIVDTVNRIFSAKLVFTPPRLPVGISFYTFQAMSYTVDIYRNDAKLEASFFSFATYLTLFPQLIAGPIVRYSDISDELCSRKTELSDIAEGFFVFSVGLAKKTVIANTVGLLTEEYIASSQKTVLFAWLYALSFTLQIYFDFSGYSDMAVGLGRLFGFSFPKNFDYPYISASITEFWHRWHITLSSFFKSYVYIPLGGNRVGKARLAFNIAVVWVLTGLWHGSAWTFVLWGALYALLLIFEKFFLLKLLKKLPVIIGRIYTLFFVTVGFVIFNAPNVTSAAKTLSLMLGGTSLPIYDQNSLFFLKSYLPLIVIAALLATPLFKKLFYLSKKLLRKKLPELASLPSDIKELAKPFLTLFLLIISTAFIVGSSFNPFLYFRF